MAYVQSQRPNQRIITLGAVAALHAAAGYALITGLAVKLVERVPEIFQGTNVKVDVPLDPLPPPPPRDTTRPPEAETTPRTTTVFDLGGTAFDLPEVTDLLPRDIPDVTPQNPPPPRFAPEAARPRGNPGGWVTEQDYPTRALREGREGVTRFTLAIGADGRVTRCDIVGSSGHHDLDAQACARLASRARFDPARDGNGEKTAGSYSNSIRWVIPD